MEMSTYLQKETEYLPWVVALRCLSYMELQLALTPAHKLYAVSSTMTTSKCINSLLTFIVRYHYRNTDLPVVITYLLLLLTCCYYLPVVITYLHKKCTSVVSVIPIPL